jgi:hypothetical protein
VLKLKKKFSRQRVKQLLLDKLTVAERINTHPLLRTPEVSLPRRQQPPPAQPDCPLPDETNPTEHPVSLKKGKVAFVLKESITA